MTGGLGYIGSHTVAELADQGMEPIILDNLSNAHPEMRDRLGELTGRDLPFHRVDCRDKEALVKVLREERPDGVIHFAAFKAVNESVRSPLRYYDNNVGSTVTLLQAMEETGRNRIVFSSSCTVYGQPEELPVTEGAPFKKSESPYGETKKMCERVIEDAATLKGELEAVALRYFNPIGAHPSGRIGEMPHGEPTTLVPYIVQTADGIRDELTVHGADHRTPDGTCIRDFIHVMDVAKAHVKAFTYMEDRNDKGYKADFNIGTGRGHSVLEAIEAFEKANGIALDYRIGPRREGDVEQIWADVSKAREEMGWQAEKGLTEAMRDAWSWQKELSRKHDTSFFR